MQRVLSEHSQQFLNIRVTAYKTDGDSLATPAPFSAVSVNTHNTGNTFRLFQLEDFLLPHKNLLLIQMRDGLPAYFPGQPQDLWILKSGICHLSFQQHCEPSADLYKCLLKSEEKMGLSINPTLVQERWWHNFKCVLSHIKYNVCTE